MPMVHLTKQHVTFIACLVLLSSSVYGQAAPEGPIEIGSRRELFLDDLLIASLAGDARRRLHEPVRREIAVVHDEPWEGNGGNYHTVFYDPDYRGGVYRMYYHAWQIGVGDIPQGPLTIGYCESEDGVRWTKPKLGLFEFAGSKENNIVLGTINGKECHDLSVFKDLNPRATKDAKYKAVGYGRNPSGLYAFKSPDGIRWTAYNASQPVMTGHPFDTQNIAFWDPTIERYRAYIRDFDNGRRDIMTATSTDFIQWTKREWLEYPNAPKEQLYTNQIKPYYRAPHILIGFPARYVDRGWLDATRALPSLDQRIERGKMSKRYGTAVTDGLLMSSRDGRTFRRAERAFLRPGLRTQHNWAYGDNYIAWHIVETDSVEDDSPRELSLYATESYFTGRMSRLRRYTLRIDGFASIHAPLRGGELLTKPLVFEGKSLSVNCATSAAGSLRVEVQGVNGRPIPGFALDDCELVFGDSLDYRVRWQDQSDLSKLSGKAVRLRFVLHDSDLYSLRFVP